MSDVATDFLVPEEVADARLVHGKGSGFPAVVKKGCQSENSLRGSMLHDKCRMFQHIIYVMRVLLIKSLHRKEFRNDDPEN